MTVPADNIGWILTAFCLDLGKLFYGHLFIESKAIQLPNLRGVLVCAQWYGLVGIPTYMIWHGMVLVGTTIAWYGIV